MKTTADHAAALHSAMYDAMLETHELISPRDLPGFVAQFEEDTNAPPMDADTIREALRRSSNDFVNAMIQNEHDTTHEEHLAPLDKRVARWEALRPIVRRTAEIAAELAPAPRTLHLRQDPAGQWQYQTREAGAELIPWQYGGFDRAATIEQARGRFAFDAIA